MGAPIVDFSIKVILEHALKEIREKPDLYLPNIFGSLLKGPNQALFGKPYLEQIKSWVKKTPFPVVLGYDLAQTELPAITVTLGSMTPDTPFIGDVGHLYAQPIQQYERDVVVPTFFPKEVELSEDAARLYLTMPDDMQCEIWALVGPPMHLRDSKKQEFLLGFDEQKQKPYALAMDGGVPVSKLDISRGVEAISPYSDRVYEHGDMWYAVDCTVTVHAPQDRNDGAWLWQIVMWSLLRYRPLMTKLFGFDLTFPSASDFRRDDQFDPQGVWTREIRVSTKVMWSWIGAPKPDILGLILSYKFGRAESTLPSPGDTGVIQLTDADLEAIAWARSNPDDPKAALILKLNNLL